MKVRAIQKETNNEIIFTWDNDLQNCDYLAIGIEGDELEDTLDRMILTGACEGNDYKGWIVTVE